MKSTKAKYVQIRVTSVIAVLVGLVTSLLTPLAANAAITACTNPGSTTLTVGVPANITIPNPTGSPGTPVYSVATGALPSGLSISSTTGAITGTPLEATTSPASIGLQIVDGGTITCTGAFNITVQGRLTPSSISNLTVPAGVAITSTPTIAVSGLISGSSTVFGLTGTLPAGLSLNTSNGSISGTPTADTNGPVTLTLQASDGTGRVSQSISFTIEVNSTIAPTSQTFAANLNQAFASPAITVRGFTPTFSISPSLPTGLSLDPSSGAVYGTPTALLGSTVYTITATSGPNSLTSTFTLSVVNNRLATPSGFNVTTGNQSATISWAAVPNAATYSIALSAGTGTCNSTSGSTTATCTGLTNGTAYTLTVTANATASFSASNPGTSPSFTPNAQLSTPTNISAVAGNANVTVTWSAVPSATGYIVTTSPASTCTFNNNLVTPSATCTGLVNGTLSSVSIVATANGFSNSAAGTQTFTPSAGTITPATQTLEYVRGVAITPTSAFTTTGLTGTITYALAGTLPTGLTFSTATGVISGTASVTQIPIAFVVTATGSLGGSATATIIIRSKPGISPTTQTLNPAQGLLMQPSATLTGVDFVSAPTYTVSPTLPAGLTLNPSTGVISGTPLVTSPTTTYIITGVDSASNVATTTVVLTVVAPGVISPASQTLTLTQNVAMQGSSLFQAAGFTGAITYTVSPALPAGLVINAINGQITGTPTTLQSATTYTVTATGATIGRATATVVISVIAQTAQLTPSTLSALNLTRGVQMSATPTFAQSGFSGTVTYSVAPALPAGLLLNASTGSISGTPTAEQAATNYVITARGATSGAVNVNVSIAVASGLLAPASLVAAENSGVVALVWTAATGANSYQVTSMPAGPSCSVTGVSARCTGLQSGISYTFSVKSVSSTGAVSVDSRTSNSVSTTAIAQPISKKFSIYFGFRSTTIPSASYLALANYIQSAKAQNGKQIKVNIVGFIPARNATALDRRTALARANGVRTAIQGLALSDLMITSSATGRSIVTGSKSRRVEVTVTYSM